MEVANINAVLIDALETSSSQNLNDVAQSILNFCQYTYISGIASTHAISFAIEKLEQQKGKRQLESATAGQISTLYKFLIINRKDWSRFLR